MVYAIRAAARHPSRVDSTTDGRIKVAFIPVLLDYITRMKIKKNNNKATTDSGGILQQMAEIVHKSSLYPHVRHVIIANDWVCTFFCYFFFSSRIYFLALPGTLQALRPSAWYPQESTLCIANVHTVCDARYTMSYMTDIAKPV